MSRVLRKDIETKNLRKTIIKFSKDIPVVGERHRGVFSITGYRVYDITPNTNYVEIENTNYVEIEGVFKGEIFVSTSFVEGSEWLNTDILKDERYRVSKVKLNKFLKSRLFNEINSHLRYFDTKIKEIYSIKKMKWI